MSLLLSQLGGGSTTTLIADAGAAALAGRDTLFRTGLAAQTRAIDLAGRNALFRIGLTAQTTGFVQAGQSAALRRGLAALGGTFVLNGLAASFALRFVGAPGGFAGSGQPAWFVTAAPLQPASFSLAGQTQAFSARFAQEAGAFSLAGSAVAPGAGESAPEPVAAGGAGARLSGANFSRRRYRTFADALARERKGEETEPRRQTARQSPAAAKTPREIYTLRARSAELAVAAGDVSACVACTGTGAKFLADGGPKSFGLRVALPPGRLRLRMGITWFTAIGPLAWPEIESLPDLSMPRQRRRRTRRRRN